MNSVVLLTCSRNDLQWADFRSKQSYQMYTNRFRNQEKGDCLLHWPVSIAAEDGSVAAVTAFDVITKQYTACGRGVFFCTRSPMQTDIEAYRSSKERLKFGTMRFSLRSI